VIFYLIACLRTPARPQCELIDGSLPQCVVQTKEGIMASANPIALVTQKRAVIASLIGNYVEWYEFTVYAFMAGVIGELFFPSSDKMTSLLASYAVFGLAFIARPLGGIIFGHIGDRSGRRGALAAIVILLSLATGALGVLPTYAAIGIAAPALLVVCRIVQGLALGGELSGATTFLMEYSPVNRRGFYTSLIGAGAALGLITGALLALLLNTELSSESLRAWGWRVPFVVGMLLALIGFYIRLRLDETPTFTALAKHREVARAPIVESFRRHFRTMVLLFCFQASVSLVFYLVAAYLSGYFIRIVGLQRMTALLLTLLCFAFAMLLCPIIGALSDRFGRRPLALVTNGWPFVTSVPAFLLLNGTSMAGVVAGVALLAISLALGLTIAPIISAEIFPPRVRYSGSSIAYNLSQMIFGGTAPLFATYLVQATGDKLAPAYYVSIAGLLALLVSYFFLPETSIMYRMRKEDALVA
jgi:MHS family proline/betaine transporter-like MFS transporter